MTQQQRKAQLRTMVAAHFEQLADLYKKAMGAHPWGMLPGQMIQKILDKEFPKRS